MLLCQSIEDHTNDEALWGRASAVEQAKCGLSISQKLNPMRTILMPRTLGIFLSLVLSLSSTGCRSFLRSKAMKNYAVKIKPVDGLAAPNRYQEDFLYLKTLGEEVFPLEDRYFPPEKRAAMEEEILRKLGEPNCSHET